MSAKPTHVFAKWQVKAGHVETVLALLQEVTLKSREEAGSDFGYALIFW